MESKPPIKSLRRVLQNIHQVGFRIRKIQPDVESMNKAAFIRVLKNLKKIEDRRDFMQSEIGMDVTAYEDLFFNVIEDMFKLMFSKEQLALIQMYLYQLQPDKEWDGTIMLEKNKREFKVNFKTPEDVWNVLKEIGK